MQSQFSEGSVAPITRAKWSVSTLGRTDEPRKRNRWHENSGTLDQCPFRRPFGRSPPTGLCPKLLLDGRCKHARIVRVYALIVTPNGVFSPRKQPLGVRSRQLASMSFRLPTFLNQSLDVSRSVHRTRFMCFELGFFNQTFLIENFPPTSARW